MFEDITRASRHERREIVAEILADALYQLVIQGRGPRRPKQGQRTPANPCSETLRASHEVSSPSLPADQTTATPRAHRHRASV